MSDNVVELFGNKIKKPISQDLNLEQKIIGRYENLEEKPDLMTVYMYDSTYHQNILTSLAHSISFPTIRHFIHSRENDLSFNLVSIVNGYFDENPSPYIIRTFYLPKEDGHVVTSVLYKDSHLMSLSPEKSKIHSILDEEIEKYIKRTTHGLHIDYYDKRSFIEVKGEKEILGIEFPHEINPESNELIDTLVKDYMDLVSDLEDKNQELNDY